MRKWTEFSDCHAAGASAESEKEEQGRKCNNLALGELVHFQLSRNMRSTVAIRRALAVFVALRGRGILGTGFPPCCHSRAQIFRLVRRISIYPIYMFAIPDVETTVANRPSWTQFGRYSVFFSFFFSLFVSHLFLRSPRVRSIDVYDVARNRVELLLIYSFFF